MLISFHIDGIILQNVVTWKSTGPHVSRVRRTYYSNDVVQKSKMPPRINCIFARTGYLTRFNYGMVVWGETVQKKNTHTYIWPVNVTKVRKGKNLEYKQKCILSFTCTNGPALTYDNDCDVYKKLKSAQTANKAALYKDSRLLTFVYNVFFWCLYYFFNRLPLYSHNNIKKKKNSDDNENSIHIQSFYTT